jgi:hypothetical protein
MLLAAFLGVPAPAGEEILILSSSTGRNVHPIAGVRVSILRCSEATKGKAWVCAECQPVCVWVFV